MPIQTQKFYSKAHLSDALKERMDTIDKTSRELGRIQLMLVKQGPKHQVPKDKTIAGLDEDAQIAIHNAIFESTKRLEMAWTILNTVVWDLKQEND